jgi:CRISPR/Cas system CSM-associated protein Csm4 (group 5 of RAMP superfamily)
LKKSVINVVVNFLNDQSNVDELEFLLEWIKDSDNYKLFTQYISIHHFSNWAMNKADQEKIIKEINHRINTEKTRKRVEILVLKIFLNMQP